MQKCVSARTLARVAGATQHPILPRSLESTVYYDDVFELKYLDQSTFPG